MVAATPFELAWVGRSTATLACGVGPVEAAAATAAASPVAAGCGAARRHRRGAGRGRLRHRRGRDRRPRRLRRSRRGDPARARGGGVVRAAGGGPRARCPTRRSSRSRPLRASVAPPPTRRSRRWRASACCARRPWPASLRSSCGPSPTWSARRTALAGTSPARSRRWRGGRARARGVRLAGVTTFGLVHGAWHGAWCWELLVPELEGRGHRAVAVDLPGDDPAAGCAEYATVVCDRLRAEDSDVVLVGHSLGGLTIPLVAAERPVQALVFLCALIPVPGRRDRRPAAGGPDDLPAGVRRLDPARRRRPLVLARREPPIATLYADCPRPLADLPSRGSVPRRGSRAPR